MSQGITTPRPPFPKMSEGVTTPPDPPHRPFISILPWGAQSVGSPTLNFFPPGPCRFRQREYLIIAYRTDPDKLRALVPEPLEVDEPVVKYEFIRMPDSTGFGDYTETGQVIPVSFRGRKGGYSHCMFLNDDPPIAGGRELWGFPKKLAQPSLRAEIDTLFFFFNDTATTEIYTLSLHDALPLGRARH